MVYDVSEKLILTRLSVQNAPKDKLLVWNLEDGWEPLCKFLGKSVPSEPLPHLNKKGNLMETVVANHPVAKRLRRDGLAAVGIFSAASLFLIYHFATTSWRKSFLFRGLLAVSDTAFNKVGYFRR